MDFKKILAGMSAMAIASTVAATAFADEAKPATPDATTTVTTTTTTPTTAAASGTTTELYKYTKEEAGTKQTIKSDALVKGSVMKIKTEVPAAGSSEKAATYVQVLKDGKVIYAEPVKDGAATVAINADCKDGVDVVSDGKILSIDVEYTDKETINFVLKPLYEYGDKGGTPQTEKINITDSSTGDKNINKADLIEGSKLRVTTAASTKNCTIKIGYTTKESGTKGKVVSLVTAEPIVAKDGTAVYTFDDSIAKALIEQGNLVVLSDDGLINNVEFIPNEVTSGAQPTTFFNGEKPTASYDLGNGLTAYNQPYEKGLNKGDVIRVTANVTVDDAHANQAQMVISHHDNVAVDKVNLVDVDDKQVYDGVASATYTLTDDDVKNENYVVGSKGLLDSISVAGDSAGKQEIIKVEIKKAGEADFSELWSIYPKTYTVGKPVNDSTRFGDGDAKTYPGDTIIVKTSTEAGKVKITSGFDTDGQTPKVIGEASIKKNNADINAQEEYDKKGYKGIAEIKIDDSIKAYNTTYNDIVVSVDGDNTIMQLSMKRATEKGPTVYHYEDKRGDLEATVAACDSIKDGDEYRIYPNKETAEDTDYNIVDSYGKKVMTKDDSTKPVVVTVHKPDADYKYDDPTAVIKVGTENKSATAGASATVKADDLKKGFKLVPVEGKQAKCAINMVKVFTTAYGVKTKNVYNYAPQVQTKVVIDSLYLGNVMDGDSITVTTEKGAKVTFNGKEVVAGDDGKAVFTIAGEDLKGGLVITSTEGISLVTKTVANPLVTVKVKSAKVASTTTTTAKLTWEAADKATGYIIYKYNPTTKTWDRLGKAKGTTYTVKGLTPGTSYKFAVKSFYRDFNNKVYRQRALTGIKGTTKKATVGAPSKLTVKNSAKGKVTISYAKSKTAGASYKIMYKTSAKAAYKTAKYTKATSFSKAGFKKGQTVYVAVKAYKKIGGKTVVSSTVKKAVKIAK